MLLRSSGRLLATISIALLFLIAEVGEAQKKKRSRRSRAVPKSSLKLRKSLIPQMPKLNYLYKAKKRSAKKVAPPKPIRNLPKLSRKERRFEKALDAEIKEAHKLITKYKKNKIRGELWLRQAEHYREKAEIVAFRLQEKHRILQERWVKAGRKGKEPVLDTETSKTYNKKAIQLYRWFLEDFKKDSRRPLARYFLGYNYFEIGSIPQGKQQLEYLVQKYSKNEYGKLARFQLAEQYFEERKWAQSKALYGQILKSRKNENYLFSMYKYAWCLYHLRDEQEALKRIRNVIRISSQKKSKDSYSQRIAVEAKKALVFFYAEANRYKDAFEYFAKIGTAREVFETVADLATAYVDRGDSLRSNYLISRLLKRYPLVKQAPTFSYNSFSQIDGLAKPDLYQKRLLAWINQYNANSKWADQNKKVDVEENLKFQEDKLRSWCLHNHRLIQLKASKASFKRTEKAYQVYLKRFPEAKESNTIRYYFAELLFDQKQYLRSEAMYTSIIAAEDQKNRRKEIFLGRVLSLEKVLPSDEEIEKAVGESVQKFAFSKNTKRFVDVSGDYIKQYPKTPEAIEIRYRMGRIYYLHNHFSKAETVFKDIIEIAPGSKVAEYSANLLLDMYNLKKDYDGLVKMGKALSSNSIFKKSKVGQEIGSLVEQAAFKKVEENPSAVSSEYLSFIATYPASALVPVALFNAAVLESNAKNFSKAVSFYNRSIKSKKSEGKQNFAALKAMLSIHVMQGDFLAAAAGAERLSNVVGISPKEKKDFLLKTAGFQALAGNYTKANTTYLKVLRNYKKYRTSTLESLAQLQEDYKKYKQANGYYHTLIGETKDQFSKCKWSAKVFENEIKLQRGKAAEFMGRETLACMTKLSSKASKKLVSSKAHILFEQAAVVYRQIVGGKRNISGAEREAALAKKLARIGELEKKVQGVIKLNVSPYIVSSLALMSEAYRYMANFIRSSPIPSSYGVAEKKQYQEQLNVAAEKMLDQSKSYMKLAREKSSDLETVTAWMIEVSQNTQPFTQFKIDRAVQFD